MLATMTALGARLRGQGRRLPQWAFRRALRAAIATPLAFGLASQVLPLDIALFAAFGTQLQVLFVEFLGPSRHLRTLQFMITTSALVALGTLLSHNVVVAAVGIAVVGFCISFGGVISPAITTGTPVALFALTLAGTVPAGLDEVLPRLTAWGIACVFVYAATTLILPAPEADSLLMATMEALDFLRRDRSLRSARQGSTPLRTQLVTMHYEPDALSRVQRQRVLVAHAVVDLTDALDRAVSDARSSLNSAEVNLIRTTVIETQLALASNASAAASLRDLRVELENRRERREDRGVDGPSSADWQAHVAVRSASDLAEAASRLQDVRRIPLRELWARLRFQLHPRSPWLSGSVRIATALGISIVVAHALGAQHAFWVSFGTLTVLRTNALRTGQSAGRALIGTIVGACIGGTLVLMLPGTVSVWTVLPLALLVTGLAPGFAAFGVGQGAFTIVILVLFEISTPGSMLVIARIEDVVLGSAVSVLVAFLAWPRGAREGFRRNLATAYSRSADYLDEAVRFAIEPRSRQSCLHSRRELVAAEERAEQSLRELLIERGSSLASPAEAIAALSHANSYLNAADWIIDFTGHKVREQEIHVSVAAADALKRLVAEVTNEQRSLSEDILSGRQSHIKTNALPSPELHHLTADALSQWVAYQLIDLRNANRRQHAAVSALST